MQSPSAAESTPCVPGAEGVWASEVSARFLVPFLDVLDARIGPGGTKELLARWRVTAAELRDETAWVSLRFLEALVDESVRVAGPEVLEACGRAVTQRRYLGAVYPVLRILGSPGRLYARLPSLTDRFNKVSLVQLRELGASHAVIAYGSRPGHKEHSRAVCATRRIQLAAVPLIWDLPEARVEERGCQLDGHDACVYDIHWRNPVGMRGALVGLAAGAAAALLGGAMLSSGPGPAALLLLFGLACGRLYDYRRVLREARTFADDQHEALTALMEATEQRFNEAIEQSRRRELAERDRLEMQAKLRLSERMASVGLLASGVAHEINNPLAYVMANLEFLDSELDRLCSPEHNNSALEQLRAALSDARRGSERMERIVRELRLFARAGSPDPKPTDVAEAIEAAVAMVTGILKGRAQIVRDYHPARPVRVDTGQLGQVFLNLVVNAAEGLPDGAAHLNRIYLRVRDAGGAQVIAEVADTGPGVPAEIQGRIFEPFFTTKKPGEGMGLGLYICQSIVHEAGGSLHVDSEEGKGATFRVLLPACGDGGGEGDGGAPSSKS